MDPETQHQNFVAAVNLLGGGRSAAREIGVSDRTMERLVAGQSRLHEGFLRDMADALIRHADACRTLERQLSPAFVANLTEEQLARPAHGNAYHLRKRD